MLVIFLPRQRKCPDSVSDQKKIFYEIGTNMELFLFLSGVLLHYEDATLRDLYFLDPQWLCDMLAHVVTVREINPFARTGKKQKLLYHKYVAKSIIYYYFYD